MASWYTPDYQHEVQAYYEVKNASILRRYGPGPIVHWHTGILHELPQMDVSLAELHTQLVISQQRTIEYAGAVVRALTSQCTTLLDIGCGLGGGSIFWAQEFEAQVTAVTISPGQVAFTKRYAEEAGVSNRVTVQLCDGTAVPGHACFDIVVAIDSSDHMPRAELFQCVARVLRPGGVFLLTDGFFEGTPHAAELNSHWHMNMGGLAEYGVAAEQANLKQVCWNDLSISTENFWALTQRITQLEMEAESDPDKRAALQDSLRIHQFFHEGYREGTILYQLMAFTKPRKE